MILIRAYISFGKRTIINCYAKLVNNGFRVPNIVNQRILHIRCVSLQRGMKRKLFRRLVFEIEWMNVECLFLQFQNRKKLSIFQITGKC